MEKRFQVFISSTYTDLVDERREVIQALLELDCIPAGMEMFPASNDDQWGMITRVIDDCDYYIVVIGGRYGSVTPEGISYTEREYDYAVGKNLPVMGFVHDAPDAIELGRSERDPSAITKLEEFRTKVQTRMCKSWRTPDQLGSAVSRSLIRAMRDYPAEGWVRGRFAATEQSLAEMNGMRAEVAELRLARISEDSAADEEFEDLAQGADEFEITYAVKPSYLADELEGTFIVSWDELVQVLGPLMMDEASETRLQGALEEFILDHLLNENILRGHVDHPKLTINRLHFHTIVIQLRALGVVDHGQRKRAVADRGVYWTLTARGNRQLVRLSAIRRDSPPEESTHEGQA